MPTKVHLVKAMVFLVVMYGWCQLDYKESWAPKNWCFWTVVLEKTLESPLDFKEIQPVHPKGDQSWVFIGRTDVEAETPILLATWCEELTHWERPWCWEKMKVRGKGDDRGWDGWMASLTQRTWVWVNSGSWQWTGRPGVLQSTGSQRVGHNWATELNLIVYTQNWYITPIIQTPPEYHKTFKKDIKEYLKAKWNTRKSYRLVIHGFLSSNFIFFP